MNPGSFHINKCLQDRFAKPSPEAEMNSSLPRLPLHPHSNTNHLKRLHPPSEFASICLYSPESWIYSPLIKSRAQTLPRHQYLRVWSRCSPCPSSPPAEHTMVEGVIFISRISVMTVAPVDLLKPRGEASSPDVGPLTPLESAIRRGPQVIGLFHEKMKMQHGEASMPIFECLC